VDYGAMDFIVINSIQEQQAIIESQKAEIDELKAQMKEMQAALKILTNKK
jgi:predicted metal-dependent hydrolase